MVAGNLRLRWQEKGIAMGWLTRLIGGRRDTVVHALMDDDRILALRRIREHANLNQRDEYGHVALHYAAKSGYLDVIRELLNSGVQVDPTNNRGKTPLLYAMWSGQPDAAKLLWKHCAPLAWIPTLGD